MRSSRSCAAERRRRGAVVATVLALCALDPAGAAAAGLGFEVRATPDSRRPLERIAITVPPWGVDAVRTVYVLRPRAGPLDDVRFEATVDDGPATVSPAGAVSTPGRDGIVPVRISVAEPRHGQTGALVATAGGRGQTLAAIAIKRDPDAVVSVAGADDEGVSRISRSALTSERFTLASGADREITDLRIRVPPLRDPEGLQVRTEAAVGGAPLREGRPHRLPARGTLTLTVSAVLEVAGEHHGAIQLAYGGLTTAVPLRVRRVNAAPTIALADPEPMQLLTSDDKSVFLQVRETGGHTIELPPPSVLLRRSDGGALFSVPSGQVLLDGRRAPVELQPGQARALRVSLAGLDGPGRYAAHLSFGGEPRPTEATATVFVRHPAWIAVLILVMAVALSEGARELRSGRIAALRRGRAMAAVDGELGNLATVCAPAIDEQLERLDRAVPPGTGAGRTEPLAGATQAVRTELVETRRSLERIADADSARTAAWRAWFEAAAEAVAALVERTPGLPGVTPAGRNRLRQQLAADMDEIRQARDPRLAVNRYCDASAQFLDTAATGLALVAAGDGADRADVGRLAESSARAARSGDLARAWDGYIAAAQAWNGSGSRRTPDREGPPDPAAGTPGATTSPRIASRDASSGNRVPAHPIAPGRELAISLMAGAVAAVAGVIVLYEPDRAWGTFSDAVLLVAFAVAIHQGLTHGALRLLRRRPAP
jgi:hypothetical protein